MPACRGLPADPHLCQPRPRSPGTRRRGALAEGVGASGSPQLGCSSAGGANRAQNPRIKPGIDPPS
nr:MAG TPA: hypothetical protein [Caudoviricetes sp.]